MFGVYDGHAGRHVSQYLKDHLFEKVTKEPEFEEGDYEDALSRAYAEMNREILLKERRLHLRRGGAVAVTALLFRGARAVIANAGDARAVLCKEDVTVEELTQTHRASEPREARSVRARGGEVVCKPETGVCRVDGRLMPSRGFGDLDVSDHITVEPHVWSGELPEGQTSFLVLASDGLWDAMGDLEVAQMVMSRQVAVLHLTSRLEEHSHWPLMLMLDFVINGSERDCVWQEIWQCFVSDDKAAPWTQRGDTAQEKELEVVARDLVCASERGGSKDDVSVIVCRVRRAGKKRRRGREDENRNGGEEAEELEGGDEEEEEGGGEEEEEDEELEGEEEEEDEGEEDITGIVPPARLAGG
ncbi:Putative protein phosphatase 2C family protein [Klebsormidium nitens]|uniref:protein-serine/threonine phosphatase n=1 Tax=Klebsormidium nitens TaxID=105231 RepID=A0A1Y1I3G4_KLENI|nr:Putative protein phosphatase 2C family protein [Klebsormidium nitens]|eukprot:GAQ83949.1 Putative protein phosphatase 2C family protein [Klebsormidium nitens]